MKTINQIAIVLILIAIILGACISRQACKKNAQLNEYKILLQDCKDQLGVFYHDEDKK